MVTRRKNEQKKLDFTCGFKDTIETADNQLNILLFPFTSCSDIG